MAVSIHGNNGVTTTNGTAAAPSLAAPDNDTGLYFGTNLIHASTDGTERLRIQADGNVAIGTNAVSAGDLATGTTIGLPKLHVDCGHLGNGAYHIARFRAGSDNDWNAAVLTLNHSNDRGLALYGGRSTGTRSWGAIRSIDTSGRVTNAFEIIGDEGQGVERISLYTGDSTTTTERLRITSTGQVNIGGEYTQTDSKVTIIDASRPIQEATLNLQSSATSGAANTGAVLRFYGHSGTEGRYHSSIKGAKENGTSGNYAGYLAFNTRPNGGGMTENLRIHSTGKVTIASGTKAQETSTGLLLLDKDLTAESDVGDPSNYHLIIRSQSNSNTSKLGIGFQNTSDDDKIGASILHHRTGGGSVGDLAFYTSPSDGTVTEAFRISSTGTLRMDQAGTHTNVLANDTGGPNIWLKNTSNTDGNFSKIGFFNSTGYITAFIAAQYQDAGDRNTDLVFGTRANGGALAEALRIQSGGMIGIGEDNPDGNKLLIRAGSSVGTNKGHIMLTGDSATNGQGPQIVFSESGSGSSYAGAYVGHIREGSNSQGSLVFGTRNTGGDASTVPAERIRIYSTGQILYSAASGDNTITSKRPNSAGSNGNYFFHLKAQASGGTDVGALGFHRDTNTDDSRLVLFTKKTGGSESLEERLRINSLGEVTIGTGNDGTSMSEFGSNTGGLTVDDAGVSNTGLRLSHGSDDTYLVQSSNGNFYMSAYTDNDMIIGVGTGGNQRLNISGNHGGATFTGSTSGTLSYTFQNGTSGSGADLRVLVKSYANSDADPYIKFDAGGTNMIVGLHYLGTSNNRLRLGAGEAAHTVSGIEIAGNGTVYMNALNSGSGHSDIRYNTSSKQIFYDSSSRLVKTDIEDLSYGLDTINQLRPRIYKRTDCDGDIEVGFIADEVVNIIPEIVPTSEKSLFTKNEEDTEIVPSYVEYKRLTAVLTKAVQELSAKVDSLETEVAALKGS